MIERRPPTFEGDELPALPPLDDDGELLGDAVPDELIHEDRLDLDDAANGDDSADADLRDARLVGDDVDDGAGLDDEHADMDVDAASELVAGDEHGLLEGSDEGDGRDVSEDEASLFDDARGSTEDGGAEGTGEDPALGIEPDDDTRSVSAVREDDEDDDLPFDATVLEGEAARGWPAMADVMWTSEIVAEDEPRTWVETPTRAGDVVVDRARGELLVSIDGGLGFRAVDGCGAATAVAALAFASRDPRDRVALVALFDAARDASSLAVVRAPAASDVVAEIVAEIAPAQRSAVDDDDEHARVDSLTVESCGPAEIVVVASGPFGRIRIRGR
jgi:hypothetical protein